MIPAGSLDTPEGVEQLLRSVAMLAPQAQAFDREEALVVLERLGQALRMGRA